MSFSIKLVLFVILMSSVIFSTKTHAKIDNYEAALQAYNQHDIEVAFIHLKNALRENESNLPAKLLLAEVLIKKHLYSSAEQELNDAIAQGADINLIISPLGRTLLLQGKFELVLQLANENNLHKQGQLAFNLIKAKAYRGLSDAGAAEDLYQAILLQYSDNAEAMIELASIYNDRNSIEKSQKLLDKVVGLTPENSRLWHVKGQLARNQGQLENAIIYFNKANVLDPNNATVLRAMASSYIELQNLEKAQALVEQILIVSPNDLQAQLMKGNILRSLGKKQLSDDVLIKLTNQLSSIDESYMLSQPQLLLIDAMSSYSQENWLQAQKKFKIYINQGIENNDMSAVVLLADVYVKSEQPELALKLLAGYESHLLKNKDYALILAGLYLQFNQNFKADYVLKKVRKFHGDDEDVLIFAAKILNKTGQIKEALSLLESSKNKEGVLYKHSLAVTALRLGKLDKALAYSKSLISIAPEVVEYQLLYVSVLLQFQQFDDVEKIITDLYKKYPENKQVRFSYAFLQFNLDNVAIAEKMFNDLVKEDPESWFVLAQMSYDSGDIKEAIAILDRQTRNSVNKNKALYKLSQVHYSQQQFEKSLLLLNVLLQKNRLDTHALSMKAKNLIALKQIDEAKHQLDILFGMWSDDAPNLFQLSRLQLRAKDFTGAEKSLKMAYALAPRALPVIIDIIKLKIRLNKLAEASNILRKAEQVGYQENMYLMILKGDIEIAKNNVNAAFSHYLTVLKKDDANVIALVKLSQISNSTTLSKKFIKQLSHLVDKYPERTLQRHIFADHLLTHQKFEQAKFQYQLLITQDIPTAKRALALNNLAIVYLHDKAYKPAAEVSKQAYEMLPSPAITDTLGWSLVLSGEEKKGLTYLRQAFSMSSIQPDIQYHIAYALVKLNRQEEAKTLLIKIIKLPDTFTEHKLAKQLMDTL